MEIELIKQTFRDERGYKILKKVWCCEILKENPLIDLYDEYFQFWNTDTPQMAICESYFDNDDSWEQENYYPISICPFCGKPITISVIREEDVTDTYNELVSQREDLWKKCQKTDSKKKEQELRKQVRDLDDKIEYFYNLCEYESEIES